MARAATLAMLIALTTGADLTLAAAAPVGALGIGPQPDEATPDQTAAAPRPAPDARARVGEGPPPPREFRSGQHRSPPRTAGHPRGLSEPGGGRPFAKRAALALSPTRQAKQAKHAALALSPPRQASQAKPHPALAKPAALALTQAAQAKPARKPRRSPKADRKPAPPPTESLDAPASDELAARTLGDAYRAYDAGELATAEAKLSRLGDGVAVLDDYVLWLRGMVALRSGDPARAEPAFRALAKLASPLARDAAWRIADCAYQRGDRTAAARAYQPLIAAKDALEIGDVGTAMWRIAESRRGPAALAAYRALVLAHPAHPLALRAEQALDAAGAPPLTHDERITRAQHLVDAHLWDEAVAELSLIPADVPADTAHQRDYWLGITLFKMRRRYGDAGQLLLGVYPELGGQAAEAMFHGARALSRADRDDEAIVWYGKVVAAYPGTAYAQEAQFLAGWLEFNRGRYAKALPALEASLAKYPRSKFVDDALWFLGMSHYFLGQWDQARVRLDALARRRGALEGGKGSYWLARIDERLGKQPAAIAGYTQTVTRFPFSWYALLSRARLAALGTTIPPFGTADAPTRGPKLAERVDEALASDRLIRRADALIAAGLGTDAGDELSRSERAFLKRHDRAAAFAILLDRYRKAGNYYRPWMLAVSYSGSALDGPARDDARRWWENAYPRAYRDLVEKYQDLGKNPVGYLYSIMRKESGFNPHDLSYADAQGLLQMIPPTTKRVARTLGIAYDPGRLYEPEYNIQTGSWYIGHLLLKFKHQVPLGAGSFNSGPRPVMRWIDQYGDREIDELVELVPYTQTREYMKKVTENFARYQYLYEDKVYEQPLTVDKQYLDDRLTY